MNQLPDIRQLRVFITLEGTRSFTAAAGILNITQSAVSHSLKSLEMLLECKLIERLGKKCILTPFGEVFLHHATQAIKQLESASSKIKTLNSWGYTSLKIGISHSQCQHILPHALSEFYKSENKCEIFVSNGDTNQLLKKLDKGDLDIVFGIKKDTIESKYQFHPTAKDSLCFITHPEHEWVQNKPVNDEDYKKQRFIVYGQNSVTSSILDSHLAGLGINFRISTLVNNMEAIKAMVAINLGVGIVPSWTIRNEIKNKSLIMHPINPAPIRQWGYYLSYSRSLSAKEVNFIDTFSKRLKMTISRT